MGGGSRKKLISLAEWKATHRPDICRACRTGNPKVACELCRQQPPEIVLENYPVWLVIHEFWDYLFDGMGGISASGVRLALKSLNLPATYFKPVGVFLAKYRKALDEQQDNHRAAKQG